MLNVRVRFAPSPTGMMHLGNVRTALINFLFATQKKGTYILRIEDTDMQRLHDVDAKQILQDLAWLNFSYQEGPVIQGPHAPYFQSQRTDLYEKVRQNFEQKNLIYRCFCTPDELLKKKERQEALRLPSRYDRACYGLSPELTQQYLSEKRPYLWRFYMNHKKTVTISDMARGDIVFDLSNFSDFAITRYDETVTFMFANFVDDYLMGITHVFRGEDHLSNTANQAAMFDALGVALPLYWHLPILCNTHGKKLSKRDFGFSLHDLKNAGFLPEAICNYVATIGYSFKNEILSLSELAAEFNFEKMHSAGSITYDLDKLKWVNKQWIVRTDVETLLQLTRPFLENQYGASAVGEIPHDKLIQLISMAHQEMITLADIVPLLEFYFVKPVVTYQDFIACIQEDVCHELKKIMIAHQDDMSDYQQYVERVKKDALAHNISVKQVYWFFRLILMGKTSGPSIIVLGEMLGADCVKNRLNDALNSIIER